VQSREAPHNFFADGERENAGTDCFLCCPDERLIYHQDGDGIALCGLGPIVDGYSVVATREHIRSAADSIVQYAFPEFALSVRRLLSARYGNCLMTEHGRVAVCTDIAGTTDPHCYHAHFLLFPGGPDVAAEARKYFAHVHESSSLREALAVAAGHEEYFLFSPDETAYLVMTRPGKLMRQFARFLIAEALGAPDAANWRRNPEFAKAAKTAEILRVSCEDPNS